MSIKCIFLGAVGVGKTSLFRRARGILGTPASTIGIDMAVYAARGFKLVCWDTSGQEKFHRVVRSFLRNAKVAVYVYDRSDPATLEAARIWYRRVRALEHAPAMHIVIGNKDDLEPRVSLEDVHRAFGDVAHISCSALRDSDPREVFEQIIDLTLHLAETPRHVELTQPRPRTYYDCCSIA